MFVTGFIGLLLFVLIIAFDVKAGDGTKYFVDLNHLIIVIGAPLGLGLASWGARKFFHAVGLVRSLFVKINNEQINPIDSRIIKALIRQVYMVGVIAMMVDIMFVMIAADLEYIRYMGLIKMTSALLPIFYAFIISEGFLRPTLYRISRD